VPPFLTKAQAGALAKIDKPVDTVASPPTSGSISSAMLQNISYSTRKNFRLDSFACNRVDCTSIDQAAILSR